MMRYDSPIDYIDTSVVLSIVLDKSHHESQEYLNTVGYKMKNRGVFSQFAIGELFSNILLKLKEDMVRRNAYDVLDWVLGRLIDENRATILGFDSSVIDSALYDEITGVDYEVSGDDAFHIICAIKCKAACFVTKDKALCSNQRLKDYLMRRFDMKLRLILF